MSLGVFDLTGKPFLILYAGLFVLAVLAAIAIPRWLRPEGRMRRTVSAEKLAYLAGGTPRFAEALLARMMEAGQVTINSKLGVEVRGKPSDGATSAECAILAMPSPVPWSKLTSAIKLDGEGIEKKLVADGLLIDRATAWQMRIWQTLPLMLLIGFGLTKREIGIIRDKPVGILTAFLVVTALIALLRFAVVDRRTRSGMDALEDALLQNQRLKQAPASGESEMAVALFGTAVLAGSSLDALHTYRRSSEGGSGGDSSGSSGGDGGSGGGGCGGCGS